jgi:hypothetical protein
MMSSTSTTTTTFTRTHAKQLASKVVTDLYQCSIHYERPSANDLEDYQTELIEMLANGYVAVYEFGFKKSDKRMLSWRYTIGPDGGLHGDSDAGNVYAKAALVGATYFNFMSYSQKWWDLTDSQRTTFKKSLPFQRSSGSLPGDGDGYWQVDHGYSAGGVRVERETFRPL